MAADYAGPSVDLSAQRHAAPARRTRPPHQPRPCVPERRVRLRNAGIPGTGTSPTPPPTAATPTHPRRPPNVGGGCVGGRPRDRWHTPWSVQREVASAPPPHSPSHGGQANSATPRLRRPLACAAGGGKRACRAAAALGGTLRQSGTNDDARADPTSAPIAWQWRGRPPPPSWTPPTFPDDWAPYHRLKGCPPPHSDLPLTTTTHHGRCQPDLLASQRCTDAAGGGGAPLPRPRPRPRPKGSAHGRAFTRAKDGRAARRTRRGGSLGGGEAAGAGRGCRPAVASPPCTFLVRALAVASARKGVAGRGRHPNCAGRPANDAGRRRKR